MTADFAKLRITLSYLRLLILSLNLN